jgi:hypothetical protein
MTEVCITVSGLFLRTEIILVLLYSKALLNLSRTMNEPLMVDQGVTKQCCGSMIHFGVDSDPDLDPWIHASD